jgi:hypothetical protein
MKRVTLYAGNGSVIKTWLTDSIVWEKGAAFFYEGRYMPGQSRESTQISGTIIVEEEKAYRK